MNLLDDISEFAEAGTDNITGASLAINVDIDIYTRNDAERTMFSSTTITLFVSLCALFMHSAMREVLASMVAAPTDEPGLAHIRAINAYQEPKHALEVIQPQPKLFTSLQVVEKAFVGLLSFRTGH